MEYNLALEINKLHTRVQNLERKSIIGSSSSSDYMVHRLILLLKKGQGHTEEFGLRKRSFTQNQIMDDII